MKKLKPNVPEFTCRSGVHAGRRYERGVAYKESDIPEEYKTSFMTMKPAASAVKKKGGAK